jgi:hypothetical protein
MGFSFSAFFSILKMVAPVVLMVVPWGAAIAPLVPLIINGIAHAEQIPGAASSDKKAYVMQLVADSVSATSAIKPGLIDPVLVTQAASAAIDTVIATVNVVQAAHTALPNIPSLVKP